MQPHEVESRIERFRPRNTLSFSFQVETVNGKKLALADVTIYPYLGDEGSVWEVNRINVPSQVRGVGHGRRLLQMMLDAADRSNVTLVLFPYASGNEFAGGLTQLQLIQWYERHGFVMIPDTTQMVRLARDKEDHV